MLPSTDRTAVMRYRDPACEALLQQSFQGSVPAFLTAFLEGRRLKPDELEALKRLIEEAES